LKKAVRGTDSFLIVVQGLFAPVARDDSVELVSECRVVVVATKNGFPSALAGVAAPVVSNILIVGRSWVTHGFSPSLMLKEQIDTDIFLSLNHNIPRSLLRASER